MSGSTAELQEHVDAILAMLGVRLRAGQLVIHIDEHRAQKAETNSVHRLPKVQKVVDTTDQ